MFARILLPIDLDDTKSWKIVVPKAIRLLEINPNTELYLLNIVGTYISGMMEEYFPKGWVKETIKKSEEKLKEIAKKDLGSKLNYKIIIDKGIVYQKILEVSEKYDCDLIIMSAYHPERSDYLLGPNAAKVVRHAKTPVLVMR